MSASVPMRTVSVITPNFNHGNLIEVAVRSVASQSRQVIEHIIIDDASTDDSLTVIEQLARKYPSVRVLQNARNMGPARACTRAISEARGEFIQFLSADDTLPDNSIAQRLAVVAGTDSLALICGDVGYLDVRTGQVDHRRYLGVDRPVYIYPDELVAQQRRGLNVVNGGSALVPREDLFQAKLNDPELKWHCDTIAFNAIAYRRGVWYVPGIQQWFHIGEGNFSLGSQNWHLQKPVLARIFELLSSENFSDIRNAFRDSGVLASFPHILKYLALDAQHSEFLTTTLITKAMMYAGYRNLRKWIPRTVVDSFVRQRTRC